MIRKLFGLMGLIGALLACEGLNRMSALVGAFKGGDAPFYSGMLIVGVVAAGVLLISLFQRVVGWIKWLMVLATLGSAVTLGAAPALPVIQQIIAGLIFATLGLLFVSTNRIEGKSS